MKTQITISNFKRLTIARHNEKKFEPLLLKKPMENLINKKSAQFFFHTRNCHFFRYINL